MEQRNSSSEEIDMLDLFRLIKRGFWKIGNVFLRFFNFLLRNAIILVVLLAIGLVLGYYLDSEKTKTYKTEIVVSANFESGEYLSNAINTVAFKLKNPESAFSEKIGIGAEEAGSLSFKVEPVHVWRPVEIQEKYYMDIITDNNLLSEEDKKDMFKRSLKRYKITFFHPMAVNSTEVMNKILAHIRENGFFKEMTVAYNESVEDQIQSNQFVQKQIDSLFQNYSKAEGNQNEIQPENFSFFNNTLDMGKVLQFRLEMQKETLALIKERTRSQKFLRVIDRGGVQNVEHSVLHANLVKIPLVLIGLFFLLAILRIIYRKSRAMAKEERETTT